MKTNNFLHTSSTHDSFTIAFVFQFSEILAQIKIIKFFQTLKFAILKAKNQTSKLSVQR